MVFISATLEPLSHFISSLGLEVHDDFQINGDHVIPPQNLLLLTLETGALGSVLDSTYGERMTPKYIFELGKSLSEIVKGVDKGGVLIFLPSYDILETYLEGWKRMSFASGLHEFSKMELGGLLGLGMVEESIMASFGVRVIVEDRNVPKWEDLLEKGKRWITEQERVLYFLVFRGKGSEGIDFADDYSRQIIITGKG
jgi:Rad3-related DNA helicase